jgi:hypothetical protein
MVALASVEDVAIRWRPLTSEEMIIVETLLEDASDMVRVRFPNVDADILAGTVRAATAVRVVAGMVRRAMMNRDNEGITQGAETVGPFSVSHSYANPSGNLYLSKDDILAFEPDGYSTRVLQAWLA